MFGVIVTIFVLMCEFRFNEHQPIDRIFEHFFVSRLAITVGNSGFVLVTIYG